MENEILYTIDYNLLAPSARSFLQIFQMIEDIYKDKEVFFYALYIQEVSIFDAFLLNFRPS
jgi:hypothetical protein